MLQDRFRFRVPFFNNDDKFIGYDYCDMINGINAYNAGTCYKGDIQLSTGLKDRNGKLIYEGDLLKTRFGLILKVYWREQSAMFWLETLDGVIPFTFYAKQQLDGDLMEVIGNIYENKELLGRNERDKI